MEQYTFTLCKVPTTAEAVERGVAWISKENEHLENRRVTILEHHFVLKTSQGVSDSCIALNAEYRTALNLSIGDQIVATV